MASDLADVKVNGLCMCGLCAEETEIEVQYYLE